MSREASLLIRLHSFGDVVLAQPAAAHLASRGPVFFLTRPSLGPVAERFGPGIKVLSCSSGEGLHCLRERVRLIDPSRIVDLQGSLTTLLAVFPRRAARFRVPRAARRRILSGRGGALPLVADSFLSTAGGSGPAKPSLERRAFPEEGTLSAGIVCGGRWEMKSIPDGVVEELARLFTDLSGASVCLIAGPGEKARAEAVASRVRRNGVSLFTGDTSALLDRIERLDILVSPDSGPAHAAAALGVPHLTVFTSTSPSLGFWDGSDPSVFGPEAPCSPCHRHGGRSCRRGHESCRGSLVPRLVYEKAVSRMAAG